MPYIYLIKFTLELATKTNNEIFYTLIIEFNLFVKHSGN